MSDPRTRKGGGIRVRALARAAAFLAGTLLALLARAPVAVAGDDEWKTAHVTVRGDVGATRIRAWAELAEASYPQWKAFFDAEPPKSRLPLELDVRTDREGFLHAVHVVGVQGSLPSAGGYYDPRSRWSFLYLQPHETSTRLLVLHELTHQYQYKALQDDVPDRSPAWHREGLAEHFGYHRRTATGVDLGALDMVAIDDRPSQCAARVKAGTFDAWAVGTGTATGSDYVDALALVETFLKTTDKGLVATYRQWEREIYKTGNANAKFERLFESKRSRLAAAVNEVWGGFRAPWQVGYVGWDEEPGAIVGRGMPWAALVGQVPVPMKSRFIEAEIDLAQDAVAGGIALGVKDREHLLLADLRADGVLLLRRRVNAVWTEFARIPLSAPGRPTRPVRLRFEFRSTVAVLSIDGTPVFERDLAGAGVSFADVDGAAGLTAEAGIVRFRRVVVGRD